MIRQENVSFKQSIFWNSLYNKMDLFLDKKDFLGITAIKTQDTLYVYHMMEFWINILL